MWAGFRIGRPVRGSVLPVSASGVTTKNTNHLREPNQVSERQYGCPEETDAADKDGDQGAGGVHTTQWLVGKDVVQTSELVAAVCHELAPLQSDSSTSRAVFD